MNYEKNLETLNKLDSELSEFVSSVCINEFTEDDVQVARNKFFNIISSNSNMDLFLLYITIAVKNKKRCSSLRKKRGDFSIPDKVIDGVISAIVAGESVSVACKFAGITKSTLYNRIHARGYDNVKEFFKSRRF